MSEFFECGPFSASDGEGRLLYENAAFSLSEGICVSLVGLSGSGKSTLLRQVAALDPAPAANRSLGGSEFSSGELPSWRSQVTLLLQDAPMIPGSVRENLSFPFEQRMSCDRKFDEDRAAELLAEVGLGRLPLDRKIGSLSGGERHRLGLVRGLLWDPPVLIADEPLSGLDPESAAECFQLLLRFAHRTGRTLLCALHYRELGAQADRHLQLVDGKLREQ